MTSLQTGIDLTDENACKNLVLLLKCVEKRAYENERFFTGSNKLDVVDQMFRESFQEVYKQTSEGVIPVVQRLFQVAWRYDADVGIRANGIRSWLGSVHRLATAINQLCAYVESKRTSVFFRRVHTARRLKAHSDYLAATRSCLDIVERYTKLSSDSVILDVALDKSIVLHDLIEVISDMRLINVAAFRGRTPCFHHGESIDNIATGVLVTFGAFCQAFKLKFEMEANNKNDKNNTYIDVNKDDSLPIQIKVGDYDEDSSAGEKSPVSATKKARPTGFLSCFTSSDALAESVRWGLANLELDKLQAFWNFGDHPLLLASVDWVIPQVKLSRGINLYSVPITVRKIDSTLTVVEPPSSGSGLRPTKARIISSVLRQGQEYWLQDEKVDTRNLKPASDAIIFQVHGGGFICQSSRSQEVYLRKFCAEADAPFYCVDYTLVPHDVFPRAVEETLFAYCWMLENMAKLGSTGKKIVCFGDSAGCCLLLSMCYRLMDLGVRLPDSMLFVYPFTCGNFAPSPSRLLAHADPIVPIPLLLRCCLGYADLPETEVRRLLGISNSREAFSAPASVCNSPVFPPSIDDEHESDEPPRRCESAPGSLFERMFEQMGNTNYGHGRKHSEGDYTPLPSASADFCGLPMTDEDRLRIHEVMSMPKFSDAVFTPLMASEDQLAKLPLIHIVASTADPLLDDSVALCRRMRNASAKCELLVLDGLPHGFLNLEVVSGACRYGCEISRKILKTLISHESNNNNNNNK